MNNLYQKKNQYEKLINNLKNNYNKLDNIYTNLARYKPKIEKTLSIDDKIYLYKNYDNILKNVFESKSLIINKLLPQAKYEYNNILIEISKG